MAVAAQADDSMCVCMWASPDVSLTDFVEFSLLCPHFSHIAGVVVEDAVHYVDAVMLPQWYVDFRDTLGNASRPQTALDCFV